MTLFNRHAGALACAAFALTAAGHALAAEPAKPEPKIERRIVMRMGPGEEGGMGHGPMAALRDPAVRARLLRDVLQLRPDQEPALKALMEAGPQGGMDGPDHGNMATDGDDAMAKPLTTPERLDRHLEMMARRQAMFKKHAEAVKAFYAVLSPSQKKAFDALHPGPRPVPRMHIIRRMHGGPMGGPGAPSPGDAGPHAGHGGMAMMDGDLDLAFLVGDLEFLEGLLEAEPQP
jgi:hypothetical protein